MSNLRILMTNTGLNLFLFFFSFQYQFANYSSDYGKSGKGTLKFQLINQRQDFSFALFTGGLSNVCSGIRHCSVILSGPYTTIGWKSTDS